MDRTGNDAAAIRMARYRLAGKRTLGMLGKILPAPLFRPLRHAGEKIAFRMQPLHQAETLPPAFHYWSNTHLLPRLRSHGVESPERFYRDETTALSTRLAHPLRLLSLGCGDCSLEIDLTSHLLGCGIEASMTCVEFNPALLKRARANALRRNVDGRVSFLALDCNRLPPLGTYDAIIVNQFFHHVENLEGFCRVLREALAPHGLLLTSDVVGRNGHLPWPDVLDAVNVLWPELPDSHRYDRHFGRAMARYRPVDHSAYSNEGIRAQDIVSCLLAEFDFELFLTFGGTIIPFVDRRIGFNLDPSEEWDRAFIDRVDAEDQFALARGRYPASNMLAALVHKGKASRRKFDPLDPGGHVAATQYQRCKLAG